MKRNNFLFLQKTVIFEGFPPFYFCITSLYKKMLVFFISDRMFSCKRELKLFMLCKHHNTCKNGQSSEK